MIQSCSTPPDGEDVWWSPQTPTLRLKEYWSCFGQESPYPLQLPCMHFMEDLLKRELWYSTAVGSREERLAAMGQAGRLQGKDWD